MRSGNGKGSNKVIFKNIEIASINGPFAAEFKKMRVKMKDGDTGWVAVDAQFMAPLAADGPAVAVADVQVKGKIGAQDTLFCLLDVTESVAAGAVSSVAAEREIAHPIGTGALVDRTQ